MGTDCYAMVRGSAIRVTELDRAGRISDASRHRVSKSVARVTINEVVESGGDEVLRDEATDERLLYLVDHDKTIRYTTDIEFLHVDPRMFAWVGGVAPVENAQGLVVGFDAIPRVPSQTFALEVWSKLAGGYCAPPSAPGGPVEPIVGGFGEGPFGSMPFGSGGGLVEEGPYAISRWGRANATLYPPRSASQWARINATVDPEGNGEVLASEWGVARAALQPYLGPRGPWGTANATLSPPGPSVPGPRWGYTVFPFLRGGVLSSPVFANGLVSFTLRGARTQRGSRWGTGPYDINGDGRGLTNPVSRNTHWRQTVVEAAPPAITEEIDAE